MSIEREATEWEAADREAEAPHAGAEAANAGDAADAGSYAAGGEAAERTLRVLCLEDSPPDAELARRTLLRAGYRVVMDLAQDRQQFEALLDGEYDVILADFALPSFNAPAALELARVSQPDTPFICFSGTIGEEATVELLKQGADDCVLKDRMARLPFAMQRAIDDRAARRALVATEAALRESRERERFALQGTNDGLWDVQMESGAVYLSPRGLEILGYRPDQAASVAERWDELVHPDDLPATQAALGDYLEGRAPIFDVDQRLHTATGGWKWVRTRGAVVASDADGKPARMVGTHSDISDRKQVEQTLARSEAHFRSLFDNLLNGFAYCRMVFDHDGRPADFIYLEVNPAFERLTGLHDVVGKPVSAVIPGIRQASPELFEVYGRVARSGVPETIETEFKSLGTWLNISAYSTQPDTFIAVFEDVTEQRRSSQALRDSAGRLRRAVEGAVETMGAMVAARDPYTGGHEKRVTQLAVAISEQMGMTPGEVEGLRLAGLVHDIGKITVPAEILTKPGRLTPIEYELIQGHSLAGYDMVKSIEFDRPVALIVRQHHERLDGSGYPEGLVGDTILPEARVLAVADVVEAMASHRPYRAALGVASALEEVRGGAGVRYDAEVVGACERVFAAGFEFDD